jgi:hypothetical protein
VSDARRLPAPERVAARGGERPDRPAAPRARRSYSGQNCTAGRGRGAGNGRAKRLNQRGKKAGDGAAGKALASAAASRNEGNNGGKAGESDRYGEHVTPRISDARAWTARTPHQPAPAGDQQAAAASG